MHILKQIKEFLKNSRSYQLSVFANICLWTTALWYSIAEYPSVFNDFRNRVVGARLMKDGLDPYFYIWVKGLPLRYYDTSADPAAPFSTMSATPFLHWVMIPICDLPQYQLCLLWFLVQWACVLGCVWAAAKLAASPWRRQLVWLAGGAMMLSIGFRQHFFQMQSYLLVPAGIMAAVYLVWKKWLATGHDEPGFQWPIFNKNFLKSLLHPKLWLAGGLLASVVLTRPTLLLLVLPLVLHRGWRKVMFCMAVALVMYVSFAFVNTRQHYNWQQYFASMQYKTGVVPMPPYHAIPYEWRPFKSSEGMMLDEPSNGNLIYQLYYDKSENSNYSIFHQKLFGHLPSKSLLLMLQLATLVAGGCFSLFIAFKRRPSYAFHLLAAGFIMYWFFEFFSDVSAKTLYYFVMFFYLVVLYYALVPKLNWLPFALISMGILLNIIHAHFLRMHSTFGQMLIMAGLLVEGLPKKGAITD